MKYPTIACDLGAELKANGTASWDCDEDMQVVFTTKASPHSGETLVHAVLTGGNYHTVSLTLGMAGALPAEPSDEDWAMQTFMLVNSLFYALPTVFADLGAAMARMQSTGWLGEEE